MLTGPYKVRKVKKSVSHKSKYKKFSEVEIGRILQLHDDHKSNVAIAKIFKVHDFTISRVINRMKTRGVIDGRVSNGPKRKTDRRTDLRIAREVQKNRFTTAESIKTDMKLNNVSLSTIYRRIHMTTQCRSYWAAKKNPLSQVCKCSKY